MTDPVEFLLARFAEDEADAERAVIEAHEGHNPHPELAEWEYAQLHQQWRIQVVGSDPSWPLTITHDSEGLSDSVVDYAGPHIARWDPARVRRECQAKRLVIMEARAAIRLSDETPDDGTPAAERIHGAATAWETVLDRMTAVYADHPDYRQESARG